MLVPLAIPPGVYRNGTDFQAAGRWHDASLVRWADGTMQPVNGWTTRVTVTDKAARGCIAWRDTADDRHFAAGTYNGLFNVSASGTVTDITPAGFTSGSLDAAQNLGYGGGFYGLGTYGTARPDTGTYGEATTWSMDNWGQYLVACSNADGRLWEWQLDTGLNAVAISGAPTGCSGLMVTEERFLFGLGAGGNPRKLQWCDREDNTTWTPLATNEAGDFELQTSGQIMLGIKTRGQALVLTDLDAHSVTYQGPPFVYGFERVGSSCGAISRRCAVAIDQGVIWMGDRGFYRYAGGAVTELQCDVLDYLYADMNAAQKSKVYAVANSQFSEIWWFYPSSDGIENCCYVAWNYSENHWSIGEMARTCGFDKGVFSTPVFFAATGIAYNHETGNQYDGATVFAESGPMSLGAGDQVMSAVMLIPDEKTQGDVTATFKTKFHPNDTERTYGPYAMANPTDLRFTGRQVAMKVTGAVNTSWRVGIMRVDVKPGGMR